MKQRKFPILRSLKIISISLAILCFILAVFAPILVRYGYTAQAKVLFVVIPIFLIPIMLYFLVITFIHNMKTSYNEKRTAKQELEIKQKFWGRMSLLVISALIMLAYVFFMTLDLYGIILMFLLFAISIYLGPIFGRLIIKK